eukprot:5888886-Lingulodinium_polyedra.AAC.1
MHAIDESQRDISVLLLSGAEFACDPVERRQYLNVSIDAQHNCSSSIPVQRFTKYFPEFVERFEKEQVARCSPRCRWDVR